jgi:Fe-S cluster biogenesis protein NfuA
MTSETPGQTRELAIQQGDRRVKERVQQELEAIRPRLQADGGDIELVDVDADGTVKVRLTGACGGCPMSTITLTMGVEAKLKERIPEVKKVVAV